MRESDVVANFCCFGTWWHEKMRGASGNGDYEGGGGVGTVAMVMIVMVVV